MAFMSRLWIGFINWFNGHEGSVSISHRPELHHSHHHVGESPVRRKTKAVRRKKTASRSRVSRPKRKRA